MLNLRSMLILVMKTKINGSVNFAERLKLKHALWRIVSFIISYIITCLEKFKIYWLNLTKENYFLLEIMIIFVFVQI